MPVPVLLCGCRTDTALTLPLLVHSDAEGAGEASPTSGRRIQYPICESAMDLPHNRCIWM